MESPQWPWFDSWPREYFKTAEKQPCLSIYFRWRFILNSNGKGCSLTSRDLQGPPLGVPERSWSLHSGLGSIPGLGTISKHSAVNLFSVRFLFFKIGVKAVYCSQETPTTSPEGSREVMLCSHETRVRFRPPFGVRTKNIFHKISNEKESKSLQL